MPLLGTKFVKQFIWSFFTGTNWCSVGNGGCSHLCLARPRGRSCACPDKTTQEPCHTCKFLDRNSYEINYTCLTENVLFILV